MTLSISIVIPAYNEENRIISYINEIDKYLLSKPSINIIEIIIVDDGSKDSTTYTVNNWTENTCKSKSLFSVLTYFPNRGKGNAVKEGFKIAKGDLIAYSDADGASPIQELEKLVNEIQSGYDVVCGSRILSEEKSAVKMSIKRRFIGFVFHSILYVLGLAFLKDTQCGFKIFKSDIAKKIIENQKCINFSFDIEYLYLSKKLNSKIKEIPINWKQIEGSKVNVFRDSIKMLIEVIKIRFIYKYNV